MKKSFKYNILKMMSKIKNQNRMYILLTFWAFWLFGVVLYFAGTDMALITFFVGFCITLLCGAYITDYPNEKEKKMMEKWWNYFKDGE